MNFIGHLFVARWHSEEPGFGLGAMLPDFASMARVRLGAQADTQVRAGVALHHRTDDAFHHQPVFVELMQDTLNALLEDGVARGPARAVAHIGVEMLIDGELVHDAATGAAYLAALARGLDGALHTSLDEADQRALLRVHERLHTHGIPYDYRNTDAVVHRLTRALSGRPRLALGPKDGQKVAAVLPEIQARLAPRVPALLDNLRDALLNEGVLAE